MTVSEALLKAEQGLSRFPTARLDVELLLAHVLDCSRSQLISQSEKVLEVQEEAQFKELLQLRKEGKPIAYLTQTKAFFNQDFYVDERALIPRPETEEMVEDAIDFLKKNPDVKHLIDLGTGCGCIAITVAQQFPDRKVLGLEVSPGALEVAQLNLKQYPCPNLEFLESDLLTALPEEWTEARMVILANLPYIGTETNHYISEEAQAHEPHVALFGGKDGLELYRRTWEQIKSKKLQVAAIFMEMGFSQVNTIAEEAKTFFPTASIVVKEDLAGLPRTVIVSEDPFLLC